MASDQAAYTAYLTYLGVKMHFEGKFDASSGRNPRAGSAAFDRRKDRRYFYRLASTVKEDDLKSYLVAQAVEAHGLPWVGGVLDAGDEPWERWKARVKGFGGRYQTEVRSAVREIGPEFSRWVRVPRNDSYPPLARMAMEGAISPETLVVVFRVADCWNRLDEEVEDTILWPKWSLTMRRYGMLMRVDLPRYATALRRAMEEETETQQAR